MRHLVPLSLAVLLAACGEVSTTPLDAPDVRPDAGDVDAPPPPPDAAPDAPDAPVAMRTITVVVGGNGAGTVTSSPGGLTCPGTCALTVPDGATVVLTSAASVGSTFAGWSGGGCTGTAATCTVTATSDLTINASFGQNFSLIVTKTGTGTGTVTSSPAGIACGVDCDQAYPAGTNVTLTASPSLDSTFTGWSGGGCTGTGACTVSIAGAVAVNATFTLRQQTLTTAVAGPGGGTITGTGIACGADCTEAYPFGTAVPLTATADASSTFTGWSGACTGTGVCTVTMDADRAVTATFARSQVALSVATTGTGTGTVTSSPAGISCGATCSALFDQGSTVTLTAAPGVGSTFTGWTGPCGGSGTTCTVTLTAATSVRAAFTLNQYALAVTRAGTGTGTVTSSPAGITCGATCSAMFDHGTSVTLTAAAAIGSTFTGWSGACTGAATTCTVAMTAAASATATFAQNQYTLTVSRTGTGSGTVTSAPAGITCGATCSASFGHGTAVTLTAAPSGGSVFAGWGGACSGTATTCTVTMTAATSVSAQFNPPPNVVFVTSTTHTGNLGGLAGADAVCQARATAAGLAGTYRAWLSTTSVSAISRLGTASGWVRPDGKPVFNTTADIVAGKQLYPIRIDETGADLGEVSVLTATTTNGTFYTSGTDCTGFTVADTQSAASGTASNVASAFTVFGTAQCASAQHLYCFGISNTATVAVTPPASYRRAFLTSASWTPGGGLAAADALCTSEASSAGLPGTYKAMLATSTASAASRFTTTAGSAPWARVDGVQLAPTAAGLFTAAYWDTAMNVLASGTYMASGNSGVWGGATSPSTVGTAALTCGGTWSSTAGTGGGGRNGASRIGALFAFDSANPCSATYIKLACLQE